MVHHLNTLRLLLLGAWLGGAVFFSAAVGPAAFAVLRQFGLPNAGEIAGTIVNRTLVVINVGGFVICLVALLIALGLRRYYSRRNLVAQFVLLATAALATAAGEWVIAARMRALRAGFGMPIDRVPLDDPARVVFQTLHGYSVAALSVAIIAALISFFLMTRQAQAGDS